MSKIIFISNTINPIADSGGGDIVMYRHLKKLQNEGHEIYFIDCTVFSKPNKTEFNQIIIEKKWWHPPLRRATPNLTFLRTYLYFKALSKQIQINSEDIIISVLGEYSNLISYFISKTLTKNIFMFYHDDSLFNEYGKKNVLTQKLTKKLIAITKIFFVVSAEMQHLLERYGAKTILLPPLPEQIGPEFKKSWNERFPQNLTVGFSGSFYPNFHIDVIKVLAKSLESIGGEIRLSLTLEGSEKIMLQNYSPAIKIKPFRKTSKELYEFLIKEINVILVFYSFKMELELRMFTSFPSKFIQYCQFGIPILIIAPPESTLGSWCIKNNWLAYVDKMDKKTVSDLVLKLKDKDFWLACSNQALFTAQNQFNPEYIHKIFENNIFQKS
jgi:hypothetical protein